MKRIPQKLYNEIITHVPIACIDVAIVAGGSVLLVERKDKPAQGQWWLPGGRVLRGEMMADAAYRKALQETGLRCFVGPIIYTAETIFPDGPKGIPVHSINSCFLLVPKNETHVYLDNHSSSYRWTQNIQNSLHPYVKECLKGAGLK